MVKQKTIAKEVTIEGVGLHTGQQVNMVFKPAPINNGLTFTRVDLEGSPEIEALASYVVSTDRGTNLDHKAVQLYTTQHGLAALVGCDLDNVIIEVNASEPAIMVVSFKYLVEADASVAVVEQDAKREEYIEQDVTSLTDER